MLASLALPCALIAQVGLASNVSRVALVARVAPRASIQSVSRAAEIGRQGSVVESSAKLRGSTNAGYRLVVLRTSVADRESRLWVRAAGGEFQELAPGASVTVARAAARSAGAWEREVIHRIESGSVEASAELPVRYEIVVEPTL